MTDVTSQLFSGLASLVNGQLVAEDSGVTHVFSDFTIAGSIAARLRLVSIDGAPTVTAWLEHADDLDDESWTQLLTFRPRSVDGEEIVQVTGPKKYLRAAWTITGSGSCRITIDVNPGIPGAPSTIVVAEPPTVAEIPVGQARVYAVNDPFNGIAVRVRARGARAGYSEGTIGYVDRTGFEPDGGGTTIEHAKSDLEHQPLTVDVDERAITVHLATGGDAVAASGSLGADDSYLGFTAKSAGADGNNIHVLLEPPGEDPVAETVATLDDTEIDVTLEQVVNEETNSHVTTALAGANNDLKWTLQVRTGADGNSDTIEYVQNGGFSAGQVAFGGSGLASLVTFGPGTTAQDILDEYTAQLPNIANAYLVELAPGNDGTGVVVAAGPMHFAGGLDAGPQVLATAADVKAAIEADPDSAALVDVSLGEGDGSGVETGIDQNVQLSGGIDEAADTSTGQDVVDAINASTAAAELVAAKLVNDDSMPTVTGGPQPLSGGDSSALIDATLWSD